MNRIVKEGVLNCSFGKIAYKHWHSGSNLPKLFLMHGWQDHLGVFDPIIDNLNDQYEVFAWDMPGHGRSDFPQWPWTYGHSEQSSLAFEILKKIKWDEYSLVAHSWAANGMTPFVNMFPDQVQNYIVLDAYGK